jgi:hypothetical protein
MIKLVLIPKIDTVVNLKDYRPRSLCNVIYKILSKCLVNRLRPDMQDLIFEYKSTFIH